MTCFLKVTRCRFQHTKQKNVVSNGNGSRRIHTCPTDCMLYRNQYADLHNCITCGTSRYKRKNPISENSSTSKKGPPALHLRYYRSISSPLISLVSGMIFRKSKFPALSSFSNPNPSTVASNHCPHLPRPVAPVPTSVPPFAIIQPLTERVARSMVARMLGERWKRDRLRLNGDNWMLCSSQSDLEANLFKQYKFLIDLKLELHFWYPFPADEMAGLWAKISPSKSTIGHSCMWDSMCWKVYNCYPTCTKTDMVYELLRTSTDAPLASSPLLARDFSSSDELITEFCRECRIVRKGLTGDLKKAMKDGKPIIIEGMHVDPSIYLIDDGNTNKNAEKMNNDPENVPENIMINSMKDQAPDPVVIPVVLKMAEFDHKALLEEWMSTRKFSRYQIKDKDKLISNLNTIQDYLCSFTSQGSEVANISATTFPQTLDWLHNHLLQQIMCSLSYPDKRNIVARGEIHLSSQRQLIHGVPLQDDCYKVSILEMRKECEEWRIPVLNLYPMKESNGQRSL
ncbi:hypothetical protein LXL04_022252 [Taraxacum kok-saghyz]